MKILNRKYHRKVIQTLLICLSVFSQASEAGSILSSDWQAGKKPSLPWSANDTLAQTEVVVDSKHVSPFGGGGPVSARLEDLNTAGGGPNIKGHFGKPLTGPIRIIFDFKLLTESTNHPTLVLVDSRGKKGLFLTLDNNHFPTAIPGHNIVNRSGFDEAQLITPVRKDEWYQAELLIGPAKTGRYTITVTQYGGEPVRAEGLPFREDLKDFSGLQFLSNTATGAGSFVVANVRVDNDFDIAEAGDLFAYDKNNNTAENSIELWIDQSARAGGDGSVNNPFTTLEEAQLAVRKLKKTAGFPTSGVIVNIAGGIYHRSKSWNLNKEDSGLWNAPVVYRAIPGHEVILHGGSHFKLSEFEPVTDPIILNRLPEASRGSVRQLNLREQGISDFGELPLFGHSMHALSQVTKWRGGIQAPELFFDGQPMTLARWPNEGFVNIKTIVEKGDFIRMWMDDKKNQKGYVPLEKRNDPPQGFAFKLDDPERVQRWSEENDLRLLGYWFNNYSDQAVKVEKVDPDSGTVYSQQPSAYSIQHNQRYFAYNALSELDLPGEWYIDRKNGILYLYPPEASGETQIDLSLMTSPLLRSSNTSYVRFEGLQFIATRANAVEVRGGEGVVMDHCLISGAGGSGVIMSGSKHHFKNGEIRQTGATGISLNGGNMDLLAAGKNEVTNSKIHNFARIQKTYTPGVRLSGVGNRAANCEINTAPHAAILFSGNNHVIELNEIHDVCRETDDMAAIYSGRSWFSHGTIIRHNLLHNITGYLHGTHSASGVYLDDGISGIKVVGNVFMDLSQGIFFNGGRENHAENNIFINVEKMMRATDMTAAFKTWAKSGLVTLKNNLRKSPYLSPVWKAHFPRLPQILEDEPEKPKYSVIKNNLRYNSPMIIGPTGIHESFIEVSLVEHNPSIDSLPGAINPQNGRFTPASTTGLFDAIPELKTIPFYNIGRYK